MKIKKLDVFKSSIIGVNLIEASAGTGKTFTIILLYLRLLLGIGSNNCLKKIFLSQILVVTFTNAAKEELCTRIKKSIQNLYLACIEKKTTDHCSKLLLKEITNIDEAILILEKAQENINDISIYTIHGFCKTILQSHTFDLNSNFENKITENEDHLYLQATEDFWRNYFYHLPENIIKIIIQDYDSPKSLFKKIKPLLRIKSIVFEPKFKKNETIITFHNKMIKEIINFKKIWLNNNKFIFQKIQDLNINKKKYSKINVARWIKNISEWAQSITENYNIPKVLKYFSEENIKKNMSNDTYLNSIIFAETEKIINKKFSLKNIIIFHAIRDINKLLIKEKNKHSLLGFQDLLNTLLKNIKKDKNLKKIIIKKYPVAFIDEFQDTDINQYEIFNHIYNKENKQTVLFLIGDPKQAIYNFRGADIFSYLYVKSKIKNRFYLDINWRSSEDICKSINLLFQNHKNPFVFKNISYLPISSSIENCKMNFTIKGSSQVAMEFFLENKKIVKIDEYQNWIADQCANQISYWLYYAEKKEAVITTKTGKKILQLNDIAILVRNQREADIIQIALKNKNISSIYSSDKKNIFQTFEAQELLWILQSILNPTDEILLKQSMSTHIFEQLQSKVKHESRKKSYFLIERLYQYNKIWKKVGIFYMIKFIILEYQKNFNSLKIEIDYQKNINFLHIAELLQKKSQFFYKKNALIRWFEKKILQKNAFLHDECIRNLNEEKSIKIITIHKSKGLEYPIVWIPFSIDFHESKTPIYHNQKNFKTIFNTNSINKHMALSDKERLAEDVRFLYVAITRSIVHCSIGIACLIKTTKKRINFDSHIHKSALGYIVQDGLSMNYEELLKKINTFNNNYIEIYKEKEKKRLYKNKKTIYFVLKNNTLKRTITQNYTMTSFTKLQKESSLKLNLQKKLLIEDLLDIEKIKKNKKLTIHNFPKGKNTGLLIHNILKNLNFFNQQDNSWFADILKKYQFTKKWNNILITWIHDIIHTPLNQKDIFLSKLDKTKYIKEFEFFLPIKGKLYSSQINKITQSFDSISTISPNINFNPVTGIIKGFIDLVFFWKNKYYILEYKSNWLGKDNSFYCDKYIKKEMIKHRYDLQYQIYTIAIHTYLTNKIKKYNYKDNFGGVFYMFLRAQEKHQQNNGIFHCIPEYSLINKLIALFSNEK